jgi:peptide/nickel transport system permease protein
MSAVAEAGESVAPATIGTEPDGNFPAAPRRRRRVGLAFAFGWLGLMLVLAATADLLPLKDPDFVTGTLDQGPFTSWSEPLGTDNLGRSILARAVFGARVSLTVAVVATLTALVAGTAIGLLAGFRRGPIGGGIDLLTDAVLAVPPILFVVALAAVLEPNLTSLVVVLALLAVPLFIRIARANTMTFAQRPFVLAARALGAGNWRIARYEILPNIAFPVFSFALIAAATLVIAEASLSFLGLGVRPPTSSWGGMIYQGRSNLQNAPHGVLIPAAILTSTIFSLNVIGDWARAKAGRGSAG